MAEKLKREGAADDNRVGKSFVGEESAVFDGEGVNFDKIRSGGEKINVFDGFLIGIGGF